MVLSCGADGPAFIHFDPSLDAGAPCVARRPWNHLKVPPIVQATPMAACRGTGQRDVKVQCPQLKQGQLTCDVPEFVRLAQKGETNRVQQLLVQGEDPDCVDGLGFTALHGAAKKGHVRIISLLLEHRASVNACAFGWCGETPLHYACKYGHTDVVQQLLEHGANPTLESREGRTPMQHARKHRQWGAVKLLTAVGVP